jgi:hypothetical protein
MPTEKPQELILPETIRPAESKKLRQDTEVRQAELRRQLREVDKGGREGNRPRKRGAERATSEAGEVGLDGAQCPMKMIRSDEGYVGVTALKISRILPLELFAHSSELAWVNGMPCPTIEHYRRQWLAFAGTLANLTVPLDILYVIRSSGVACKSERPINILFAVLARARTESLLTQRCQEGFAMLRQVVASAPFTLEIEPPVAVPNPGRAKLLRQIARLRYGRDRQEVEEEIAETYRRYTSVE